MKYSKHSKLIANTTFSKVSRANRGPPMKVQKDVDNHISRKRDKINVDL